MGTTIPGLRLRALAKDAMEEERRELLRQEQERNREASSALEMALYHRVRRLFEDDTNLTNACLPPRWFNLHLLDPGAFEHYRHTDFEHVNQFAPIYIVDGLMLALARYEERIIVGEWHDGERPTNCDAIETLADLGRWVVARETEASEQAASARV